MCEVSKHLTGKDKSSKVGWKLSPDEMRRPRINFVLDIVRHIVGSTTELMSSWKKSADMKQVKKVIRPPTRDHENHVCISMSDA